MNQKEKMKKIAKVAKIISIAVFCLYVVTAITLFVFAILYKANSSVKTFLERMDVKENIFIKYFVEQAFTSVLIFFFIKLFQAIQFEESPFCLSIIKWLKSASIFIITAAIIKNFLTTLVYGIFSGALRISLRLTFDINSIIIGIVLLLISIIFEYGIILQKQDDETL